MIIHGVATQERVILKDDKKRILSIPTDHPLQFKLVKKNDKGKNLRLKRTIKVTKTEPIKVRTGVQEKS